MLCRQSNEMRTVLLINLESLLWFKSPFRIAHPSCHLTWELRSFRVLQKYLHLSCQINCWTWASFRSESVLLWFEIAVGNKLGLTEKLLLKMALKEVSNEGDYKSAISSSSLVAVHFQATWAPECETVSAVLQVLFVFLWVGNEHLVQELLKEAGLQGKLECFQLEAEKLAEVVPFLLAFSSSLKPGESQAWNCSGANCHLVPRWEGCG